MKKIIIILIILAILGGGGYYYYQNIYLPAQKPTLEVEKNSAQISKYYIYGTHLNLEGEIKKIGDPKEVLAEYVEFMEQG